jgi:hypothetical protein
MDIRRSSAVQEMLGVGFGHVALIAAVDYFGCFWGGADIDQQEAPLGLVENDPKRTCPHPCERQSVGNLEGVTRIPTKSMHRRKPKLRMPH